MCHYITMILPAKTDVESTSAVFAVQHRKPMLLQNSRMQGVLQPGEIYIHPGSKMCDCGTSLGGLGRRPVENRVSRERKARLRKKGWSDAKFQRWLEQQRQTSDRKERIKTAMADAVAGCDPDGWGGIMRGLLNGLQLPYVGLLLHWYSASLDSEVIRSKGRTTL